MSLWTKIFATTTPFLLTAIVAADATLPAPAGSPVFGVRLPSDYREWQVVSVAHEAGSLNDIRVILGNEVAMKAFRSGSRPFPDGTKIARLAWEYVPSAQNNAIFNQPQSFVPGKPTNVQIEVKNARRYASTGGWEYGQFEGGEPNPSNAVINTCHGCHSRLPASKDLVFTDYAP